MNEDNIYKSYCPHNNPIYLTHFCPGCRRVRELQQQKRYDNYWSNKRIPIEEFFTNYFKMYDPSLTSEDKLKIRDNDKFASLKRSNSEEELKKEYYKLAKKLHPDKGGTTKLFQKLQQIYNLLLAKL